jgi:hypothetical protein
MAVQPFNKFNSFTEAVTEKIHNLGADVLKVMLTNTAPVATNTQKSNLTDITAVGTDYPAGGKQATITTSAQTSGVYKLVLVDVVFGPVSASVGPFRYIVLYNDTATNKELIGWWDNGVAVTLTSGQSFTVDFDPSAGVLTPDMTKNHHGLLHRRSAKRMMVGNRPAQPAAHPCWCALF